MYALGADYTIENQCIENPTYEDYVAAGYSPVGCGTWFIANFYFYLYILLVSLIFLNIFIAIILKGYFDVMETEKSTLNSRVLDHFRDCWS